MRTVGLADDEFAGREGGCWQRGGEAHNPLLVGRQMQYWKRRV